MFNPESVDVIALPSIPLRERAGLPVIAAVYFVLSESNAILYIGQTTDLRTRWIRKNHHRLNAFLTLHDVRIAYLCIDDTRLLYEIEYVLITHFQPPFNRPARAPQTMQNRKGILKPYPLRLPEDLYETIAAMAEEAVRPVNSQIIFLLREAANRWKASQASHDTDASP